MQLLRRYGLTLATDGAAAVMLAMARRSLFISIIAGELLAMAMKSCRLSSVLAISDDAYGVILLVAITIDMTRCVAARCTKLVVCCRH